MTRYANLEHFLTFRENKAFAMPFRNWETIFYKLTLKSPDKIKYMPTEVVLVPPDTMVADMKYIDHAFMFLVNSKALTARRYRADPMLERYCETMLPYAEFLRNPDVFERPEILLDRARLVVLPYRVVAVVGEDGEQPKTRLMLVKSKARGT